MEQRGHADREDPDRGGRRELLLRAQGRNVGVWGEEVVAGAVGGGDDGGVVEDLSGGTEGGRLGCFAMGDGG